MVHHIQSSVLSDIRVERDDCETEVHLKCYIVSQKLHLSRIELYFHCLGTTKYSLEALLDDR